MPTPATPWKERKRKGAVGSGYQGYNQQRQGGGYQSNFYGASYQPWFNPYRYNVNYPGLIVWRI